MAKMNKSKLLNIFLIIGMLAALFLIYEHFVPSASKYCTFGQNVDCGIVNKSPYANIDGISYLLTIDYKLPLPLINISGINGFFNLITSQSFLGFLALLLLWFMFFKRKQGKNFLFIENKSIVKWAFWILVLGVLNGLYLFYIQHSILKTYCPFCLLIDTMLILSLIMVWKIGKEDSK